MNREQKAAAIAEIAANIEGAQAILAVDYRGISVPQIAELRAGLFDADTTFKVVKNSLTERAADQSGAEVLKPLLIGPTALAFVRGDVATAAKAIADYGRPTQLLAFKGGLMDGAAIDVEQIRTLSRLPPRQVLYGQLVGVVASPVSGLVRSLGALLGGLAVALGQVREKMESGEIPSAAPAAAPAEPGPAEASAEPAPAASSPAEPSPAEAPGAEAQAESEGAEPQDEPGAEPQGEPGAEPQDEPGQDEPAQTEAQPQADADTPAEAKQDQTEPEQAPAQPDDEAAASSEASSDAGDEPAKED
jgi:large subunit ribosomal protein L10